MSTTGDQSQGGFSGPLFLVGRPRSGTKLLRSLMDRHSAIAIPFWESNFIARFKDKADQFGDLRDPARFHRFFKFFSQTEFFRMIRADAHYGPIVDEALWHGAMERFSYGGALEAFYRLYAARDNKTIWGDKSPHYMFEIRMLRELFPNARFVHIIRDVRDHCLSNTRAWGKDMLRSAQMWVDGIRRTREDALRWAPGAYTEIRYEDLLADPERELARLCSFVGVSFEPDMLHLKRTAENLGDATGATAIVRDNHDKWRRQMDLELVRNIERISADLMRELGYPIAYEGPAVRLTPVRMKTAAWLDALNRFRFDCRFQGGLKNGLYYQYYKRRYG